MLDQFIDLLAKFIESLHKVFPKCKQTQFYHQTIQTMVLNSQPLKEMIVKKWHEELKPFYEACRKEDADVFLDPKNSIPYLEKINFRKKWQGLMKGNPDSIKIIWKYVQDLNRFAAVYVDTPASIRGRIESVSSDLLQRIQDGGDLKDLDVQAIGEQVLQGASDGDAMALIQNIGHLMKTMGSTDEIRSELGPNAPVLPTDIDGMMKGFEAMAETRTNVAANRSIETAVKQGWKPPGR